VIIRIRKNYNGQKEPNLVRTYFETLRCKEEISTSGTDAITSMTNDVLELRKIYFKESEEIDFVRGKVYKEVGEESHAPWLLSYAFFTL
jgi:hypothetical protein